MDIRIENGDIALKPDGTSEYVDDIWQLDQQINLAFKIPKASFVYDRKIGAFNENFDFLEEGIMGNIEARLNECILKSQAYAKVEYIFQVNGRITIGVIVDDEVNPLFTEVHIDG
ncbi:MAG: hypothetical protein J1E41_00945 [Ruminococcus sp.]|nr:hypothetical protein [Ruminococcus sp.]